MAFKLVAQIVLITAALVIIFTYVQPSFAVIKKTQDELFQYKEAISKASQFNARLQELISIRDSFPPDSIRALESFVPSNIDKVAVMRDIETIFANNGITLTTLGAKDGVAPETDVVLEGETVAPSLNVPYQDFEVSFTASYEDMKRVLQSIESNDALLEVMELSFSAVPPETNEDGVVIRASDAYNFTLILRSFGLVVS